MSRTVKLSAVVLLMVLVGAFVPGMARYASGAGDPPSKALVGNWEGTIAVGTAEMPIQMELRADGKKIVGELKTPHGPWPVTDAKYADGKWNIEVQTPSKEAGTMKGVLSGDKLEGHYDFPPSFSGEFKFTRAKGAK